MPYVPTGDRPALDAQVDVLAGEIATQLTEGGLTAELSELYRDSFMGIADTISRAEERPSLTDKVSPGSQALGEEIVDVAEKYGYKGAWLGELNYAVTRLIQAVPLKMVQEGEWSEALRYWLYAETVGALTRTASDIHQNTGNDWVSNGLVGVLEDVRDEYKRRVNTSYEAAQIIKSGDCYELTPYRTEVVKARGETPDGRQVEGFMEVMLPKQDLPE
jgi:hypothetical protein